jgi:hypothetical protein
MHSDDFALFRRMLVAIGAIGKCVAETERYIEGEFEYTAPDQLSISVQDQMCLHPMFMRVFDGLHRRQQGPVVLPRGSRITDKDYRELS